jgi:thioredoxin
MNAVKSVSGDEFQSKVIEASRNQPVLVDFWAPWCGPCQALGPTLEKAAAEFAGRVTVLKLNTDEESQIAGQYGIRSIPAVKLFRDGKVAAEFVGAQPLPAVRQFLASNLPASDSKSELPERPWTQATALARQGQLEAAQALLDALDPSAQFDEPVKAARAALHFARILQAPDDTDLVQSARVRAARNLLAAQFSSGFEDLLQAMQRNRRFATGQGREDMLQAFTLAPPTDSSVLAARRKLAALLN